MREVRGPKRRRWVSNHKLLVSSGGSGVCSMETPPNYGDKIGVVKWTFGRADNRNHSLNVNGQVSLREVGAKEDTRYGFIIKPVSPSTPPEAPVLFTARTYSKSSRITVPSDLLRENELKPGHTVNVSVYEIKETQTELVEDGTDNVDASVDELKNVLDEAQRIVEALDGE